MPFLRPSGLDKQRKTDNVKCLPQIVTITLHTDIALTVHQTLISILSTNPPISSEKLVEQELEQRRKPRDELIYPRLQTQCLAEPTYRPKYSD